MRTRGSSRRASRPASAAGPRDSSSTARDDTMSASPGRTQRSKSCSRLRSRRATSVGRSSGRSDAKITSSASFSVFERSALAPARERVARDLARAQGVGRAPGILSGAEHENRARADGGEDLGERAPEPERERQERHVDEEDRPRHGAAREKVRREEQAARDERGRRAGRPAPSPTRAARRTCPRATAPTMATKPTSASHGTSSERLDAGSFPSVPGSGRSRRTTTISAKRPTATQTSPAARSQPRPGLSPRGFTRPSRRAVSRGEGRDRSAAVRVRLGERATRPRRRGRPARDP